MNSVFFKKPLRVLFQPLNGFYPGVGLLGAVLALALLTALASQLNNSVLLMVCAFSATLLAVLSCFYLVYPQVDEIPAKFGFFSRGEEKLNALTHAIGLVMATLGSTYLVSLVKDHNDPWLLGGCVIYASTLMMLYAFSTVYHWLDLPRPKLVMHRLDHAGIFLLVAGSFTPFFIHNLRDGQGPLLLVFTWSICIVGIFFQMAPGNLRIKPSSRNYIVISWLLLVVALKPFIDGLAAGGLFLIVLSGLVYSLGVVFFRGFRFPYHHAIWHLFVIAGSILHYLAVLKYCVPTPTGGFG